MDQNIIEVDTSASETALKDAIATAPAGSVIRISEDCKQAAFEPPADSDITLDLGGHTLTSVGPFVGSPGTEANAFRFTKGSNITIQNGTLKCIAPTVTILIQNYANLTLDNVKLSGKFTYDYLLSCNAGHTILRNGTTIGSAAVASFDCYYGLNSEYDDGVTVEIEDTSVVIKGKMLYHKDNRIQDVKQWYDNAHVYIPANYEGVAAPEGYNWVATSDGKQELKAI